MPCSDSSPRQNDAKSLGGKGRTQHCITTALLPADTSSAWETELISISILIVILFFLCFYFFFLFSLSFSLSSYFFLSSFSFFFILFFFLFFFILFFFFSFFILSPFYFSFSFSLSFALSPSQLSFSVSLPLCPQTCLIPRAVSELSGPCCCAEGMESPLLSAQPCPLCPCPSHSRPFWALRSMLGLNLSGGVIEEDFLYFGEAPLPLGRGDGSL